MGFMAVLSAAGGVLEGSAQLFRRCSNAVARVCSFVKSMSEVGVLAWVRSLSLLRSQD